MAGLLASMRVRLQADTSDFKDGLLAARKSVQTFKRDLDKFRNNTLANVASIGALGAGLKSTLTAANNFDAAQRRLAAAAKITGVEFSFLESTAKNIGDKYKLSAIQANGLVSGMAKLAKTGGDVSRTGAGVTAYLDLAAANGISATAAMEKLPGILAGADEGLNSIGLSNPSQIFSEWAKAAGVSAAKMTDAQKATAIMDAILEKGSRVRGEYASYINSAAGAQQRMAAEVESASVKIGKSLQPAIVALLPVVSTMATGVKMAVDGWAMLGASLGAIPGLFEAAKMALTGKFSEAKKQVGFVTEAWREAIAEIQKPIDAVHIPAMLTIQPPTPSVTQSAAKDTAAEFAKAFSAEFEKLRPSITLGALKVKPVQMTAKPDAGLMKFIEKQTAEAQKVLAKRRNLKAEAGNIGAGYLGQMISGQSVSGGQVGSDVGGLLAGTAALAAIPGVGILLPALGGALGSLFGKKKQEPKANPVVRGLEAIEKAQRETIQTISSSTDKLLSPENRLIHAPSSYNFPRFAPSLGPGASIENVAITINAPTGNAPDIAAAVEEAVGNILYMQTRRR